ncbi:MAG TPA: hypothetical protein VIV06_11405 [Candidatus Limnocylindrales bacterium]
MNIHTISMDPGEAERLRSQYRAAVKLAGEVEASEYETRAERRRREIAEHDKAILDTLNGVLKDKEIISLRAALRAGGEDGKGRPKIAVARADERVITVHRFGNGRVDYLPIVDRNVGELPARSATRTFSFLGLLPRLESVNSWHVVDGMSDVPHIPPAYRPSNLEAYHIIWEADWRPVPPVDPILIRHLAGDFYTIVAAWDLTEIEAAVLGAL